MNKVIYYHKPIIRQIASALLITFNIGEGVELVYLLGNGNSPNNHEAVENWIKRTLATPDMEIGEKLLPTLVNRLEQILRRKEMLPW